MNKTSITNAKEFDVNDLVSDSSESNLFSLPGPTSVLSNTKAGRKGIRKRQKREIPVFLTKLFDIVSNTHYAHIVCWTKKGDSFKVVNDSAFSQQILAFHFKHSNMSSFIRQLNMYDFHKRQKTRDVLVFYHDSFQRDMKHLLPLITRKTNPNYKTSVPKTQGLILPRGGSAMRNEHR